MSDLPINITKLESVLVATFTDKRNAKFMRNQLEQGCVHNVLYSNKGRIIETKEGFKLYTYI